MKKYFFVSFLVFASVIIASAQGPPPPDGGGGPGTVNDVPINLLIYPFLVIGIFLGIKFISKYKK